MKKLFALSSFLTLFCITKAFSQPVWTPLASTRGNFSFSFPDYVVPTDTLGLLSYNYIFPTDSSICLEVHFMDSVPITGNTDLQNYLETHVASTVPWYGDSVATVLNTYAQMYSEVTGGTIEGFDSSNYQPSIRGKELTIRHPDLSGDSGQYYFAFTRYFYWNSRFLAFTVTGPENKLSQIYAYKNQLFSSVGIY